MRSAGHHPFMGSRRSPSTLSFAKFIALSKFFAYWPKILLKFYFFCGFSTFSMPPKSAAHTTKHRLSTTEKAIHKRPSRPKASAAVKTATQTLLPRGRRLAPSATHRDVTPTSSQDSLTPSHSNVSVTADIAEIKLVQEGFADALDEIKERFEGLESSITTTITNTLENHPQPAANAFTRSFAGMNPTEALQSIVYWVESMVMTHVVARTLDVAHFIKLLPVKE